MRSLLVSCALALASASRDPSGDAAAACAKLSLSDQLSMMRGFGKIDGYSRNSGCADLCGRQTFRWDNGPQGFGDGTIPGSSTQWSSSLAMAATFDPDLAEAWGTAMGEEWWDKGTNSEWRWLPAALPAAVHETAGGSSGSASYLATLCRRVIT